jgi:DNA-binding NarL/FixJ family response regulator
VDVAIVDLNLPDGSGADFIRDLQRSRSRAMALVLSATSEEKYLAAGGQLLSQQEVIEALRFLVRERESHREAQH